MATIAPQAQALVDAFKVRGLYLDPTVAQLWYGVERGSYNNPVGVTSPTAAPTFGATSTVAYHNLDKTTTYLNVYPSLQAGAAAAAALASMPQYRGFASTLTPGTDWTTQLRALIASPWNHSYYAKVLGQYLPAGTPGATQTTTIPTSVPSSLGQTAKVTYGDLLASLGLLENPNATLDAPTFTGLQAQLQNPPPGAQPLDQSAVAAYLAFLRPYVGKGIPLTQVPIPATFADWISAQGSGGWVGVGPTNPNTGQPQFPNPLSLGQLGAQALLFFMDPTNWERIGLIALAGAAGIAGFILYLRGHSERVAVNGAS